MALSALFARVIPTVIAADTDTTRVTAIQQGVSPVADPLLSAFVTEATDDGSLRATTDLPEAAAEASVHLIAVPIGLREDDAPDLSTLRATLRDIAVELSAGDILVVTTPVPPGTTEGIVTSTVVDESGLSPDSFGVAVCALPRDQSIQSIRTSDLVVDGVDTRSQVAVEELFKPVTTGTVSTTPTVATAECVTTVERAAAEMARCLSNELAMSAPQVDVPTVAELVAMRDGIAVPGPGVSSDEPIGSGFLRDVLVGQTPVIDTIYDAAREFPTLIAETVLDAVDHGPATETTVLIFGVPSADGCSSAESMPISLLIRELTRAETRPLICDPVADLPRSLTPHAVSVQSASRLDPDVVILLSVRLAFEDVDWTQYDDTLVVDCCGCDLDIVDTDVHRLGVSRSLQQTKK
jgi:UDP-N-acetyl-D-mannosaminuronic acid dehydrogenase